MTLPSYIGFSDVGYIGFPRTAKTREAFLVTLGVWDPNGSPPPSMPADAINLADQGAVTELAVVSAVFPLAWAAEAYARESLDAAFAPNNITLDFGTPSDPTKYTSAVTPEALGDTLNFPAATLETQVQITVHATQGTLADLTAGQVSVAIYMGRWPATIGRISP